MAIDFELRVNFCSLLLSPNIRVKRSLRIAFCSVPLHHNLDFIVAGDAALKGQQWQWTEHKLQSTIYPVSLYYRIVNFYYDPLEKEINSYHCGLS